MLHVSTIPAADLREGMTLANGALVFAADIDEEGALDYATHLFGIIEVFAVEADELDHATVAVAV